MCALLFGGTALLFSRAAQFGFINYDDPAYVTDNPHVQGGLHRAGIVWAFTAAADYWHPLTWLSHMLDWQLYGPAAAGHHLTSVGWHALNAALAFLVFLRLAGGFGRSAFAAALFAWHPLRVESVAWITERKDVMSGCFFLLTLLAYAGYAARRASGRPWRGAYLLALAAFAAGLMSKPMLVTLPLVLLVLDFWPLARWPSPAGLRPLLVEKLPFFALAAVAAFVTLVMQRQAGAFVLDLAFDARAGNAVVSLARYLGKFVWPFDLTVCYPHPGHWPALAVAGAGVLLAVLGALAWRQRRSRPWIAAGLLWFLVGLLPVLGLVQAGFQAMADRYTYLPLLGVELALVWSLPVFETRRAQFLTTGLAVVLLAACAARTWDQLGFWRDSVSLFEHAVQVTDRSDVAEGFLASALFAAGRVDDAAVHAERAYRLNPRNATTLVILAGVREQQGRPREAAPLFRSALALQPENAAVQMELGLLELAGGRADEARRLMTAALRSAPNLRERTAQLGRLALDHHDLATALFFEELLLAVTPDDPEVLRTAAEICARQRDFPAATRLYRRLVALAPADSAAHAGLGYMLIVTGDRAAGLAEWRRALELDPDFPGLRERLRQQER